MPTFSKILIETYSISIIASLIAVALAWRLRSRAVREQEFQRHDNSEGKAPSNFTNNVQEKYYCYASRLFFFPALITPVFLFLKNQRFLGDERISLANANLEEWSPTLTFLARMFLLYLPIFFSGIVIAKLFWSILRPSSRSQNLRIELLSSIFIYPLVLLGFLGSNELYIQGSEAVIRLLNIYSVSDRRAFFIIADPLVAVALIGISGSLMGLHSVGLRSLGLSSAFLSPERYWPGSRSDSLLALAHSMKAERCRVLVIPSFHQKLMFISTGINKLVLSERMLTTLSEKELDAVLQSTFAFIGRVPAWGTIGGMLILLVSNGVLIGSLYNYLSRTFFGSPWSELGWFCCMVILLWSTFKLCLRAKRRANRFAIQQTSDPEALVTGLARLKPARSLNKVNPSEESNKSWLEQEIDFGDTVDLYLVQGLSKHVQNLISEIHQVSEEQMQTWIQNAQHPVPPNDRTSLKLIKTPRTLSATDRTLLANLQQITQMALIISPPVLWLGMTQLLNLQRSPIVISTAIGAALLGFILSKTLQFTPGFGFQTLQRQLQAPLKAQGIDLSAQVFVSLSPDLTPQRYEKLWFWDVGHLSLNGPDLVYQGDLDQFRLPAANVTSIHWGRGIPGEWPSPSLYISWHDPQQQTQGTWRIEFRSPKFRWTAQAMARQWYDRLQNWQRSTPNIPRSDSLLSLELPQQYPAHMGERLNLWMQLQRCLVSLLTIELLGITLGMVLNLDRPAIYLICWVGLMGAVAARLPEWR